MRLRKKPATRTRRQRLIDDQPEIKQAPAFSYSTDKRSPNSQSGTDSEKLGSFWLQRLGLVIFLVAITASAVNVLSLSPSAKVLPLTSSNNQAFLRPAFTYETAVDQLLKSSIWNRSKITVDTSGIRHQLLEQFPELSNATVTVPLLAHRPLVYIEPAQPALVLAASNGTYVVGDTGKTLMRLSGSDKQPSSIPVLTDQSGLNVQLNHQALSANNVTFIKVVLAELVAKQYAVSGMVLPPASSELDIHLVGQSYMVKFNLQSDDPRGQAGTFMATVAMLKKQNVVPGQYVDVRVNGRAYYQ